MTSPDYSRDCSPTAPNQAPRGKADDCSVPSPSPTGDGAVSSPHPTAPATAPRDPS